MTHDRDGGAELESFGGPETPATSSRFRWLVASTTGLVLLTVLLGVATKAAGAGLACQARWPVCDGGFLNLLPATLPSAFEWVHRAVAGITGLAIIVTAGFAWIRESRRSVRVILSVGAVLLPIQILLGRETVVAFNAVAITLHFWTAVLIFGTFVIASTLLWREKITPRRLRIMCSIGAVLIPLQVILQPPVVTQSTPIIQALQYLVIFMVSGILVSLATVGRSSSANRITEITIALVAFQGSGIFLGRQLYDPTTTLLLLYGTMMLLVLIGLIGLAWILPKVVAAADPPVQQPIDENESPAARS